ncbi:hypothetical protein QBC41DRAFT_308236 [Cercophora samala]|uniref:Uncharacterized protein n=1 Tax=Cercophora samala TaxID=330535 RepID=A0AA39YUB2_9PEZI|nr:hypothetical protein QBC41DRAFT_308236 [Cercophora samala]
MVFSLSNPRTPENKDWEARLRENFIVRRRREPQWGNDRIIHRSRLFNINTPGRTLFPGAGSRDTGPGLNMPVFSTVPHPPNRGPGPPPTPIVDSSDSKDLPALNSSPCAGLGRRERVYKSMATGSESDNFIDSYEENKVRRLLSHCDGPKLATGRGSVALEPTQGSNSMLDDDRLPTPTIKNLYKETKNTTVDSRIGVPLVAPGSGEIDYHSPSAEVELDLKIRQQYRVGVGGSAHM